MRVLVASALTFALLSGCMSAPDNEPPAGAWSTDPGAGDAVVVAIIDSGFNPYHFDFLASMMPQHLNDDPYDDLPLDQDPASWLPGHPGAAAFASYGPLRLNLSLDAEAETDALHEADAAAWETVETSAPGAVHVKWVPGTKVIGHVTFGGTDGYAAGSHGVGTSSVSVGNLYGSCPHCLLVFVDGGEAANRWVEEQDWIDLQSNSWGASYVTGRHRVYAGSDTEAQREAVDRGQSIFFSAGNGADGGYVVTNPTLFSSQEGPDWITTVGAILPDGTSTGAGKPADVSAPGGGYPSAYAATTTNGTGLFGGTSNATPVTAGLYAEALYQLRRQMAGISRLQAGGVIATGEASCADVAPECALADGALTVHELREALLRSAVVTGEGFTQSSPASQVPDLLLPGTQNAQEMTFLAQGHGAFWGRMLGHEQYQGEVDRIVGFAAGAWSEPQDPEQKAWFIADSICRQSGWGAWEHGYATAGDAPGPDPQWPVRSWLSESCPVILPQVIAAERSIDPIV